MKFVSKIPNYVGIWLVVAVATTLVCGLVYAATQQVLRQDANDPQIQLAEDIASQLSSGAPVTSLDSPNKIELAKSLAPFLMAFDAQGKLVASSVQLDGKPVSVPQGVLDAAKKKGQNRVTWQPKKGVRNALVVQYYKGSAEGYVAIGRSLKEVEKREQTALLLAGIAWAATLIITFFLSRILRKSIFHHSHATES